MRTIEPIKVAAPDGPDIEATPGVCGGAPCLRGTRIPGWALVQARRLVFSADNLMADDPAPRAEDLEGAWAYARAHPAEIDRRIRAPEDA